MKRTAVVLVIAVAGLAVMAWPASAKGEGPVGAIITGPGIGGPGDGGGLPPAGPGGGSGGSSNTGPDDGTGAAVSVGTIMFKNRYGLEAFRNNPVWRLATFSGLIAGCSTCTSYIDTSEPEDVSALGPAYRVMYFSDTCCDNAVRQTIYPFAPGGPTVFSSDDVGTEFFLLRHRSGWWHTEGRMGQLFLRFLHHAGVPKVNPVAVSAAGGAGAAEAASQSVASSTAWRLPVAIGVMALLLVVGAMAARPRSSARPA